MSRLEKTGIIGAIFVGLLTLTLKIMNIPPVMIAPFSLPFIVLIMIGKGRRKANKAKEKEEFGTIDALNKKV